jgi:hypothetical protein
MLKAIETKYNGYRFRSRTEARWAVLFDALNIKWQYELEGVVLPSGKYYLPDFWLPGANCFVEVKPDAGDSWSGELTYLAGPMPYADEKDWRDAVKNVARCGPSTNKKHGPELHGVSDGNGCEPNAQGIVDDCLQSISQCDCLMAWIPNRERYGTIAEIGYAKAAGKRVRVAIGHDAVVPHPKAEDVGSPSCSCHGTIYGHELWFVEYLADACRVGITEGEMADWFSNKLTGEECTCAELSLAGKCPVLLARGVPGDCKDAFTLFLDGAPRWRGWPTDGGFKYSQWPIGRSRGDILSAIESARSARFEHGECV